MIASFSAEPIGNARAGLLADPLPTAARRLSARDYCWASHSAKVISPSRASGPGSNVRSLSATP